MKNSVIVVLGLVLLATACAPIATATPIPPIVLDAPGVTVSSSVKASAEVVPARQVHLSFLIPGSIQEVAVKEGEVVNAGQVLATLSSPDLEYGLVQAEAAARAAELDYEYWKLPRKDPHSNRAPERRELAAQELAVVQRSLDTARAEMTQTTLVAPFAATVVSVEFQPGEYVQSGQVVITLATLDELQIETTDLSELNIAAVEIGQPATVFVEALNEEFPGKVTAISSISNTIGGDVVFKVTIELDEQPSALLWGMSADVEIDVE